MFECPRNDCFSSFPNKDQLRKHVARKHENSLFCALCKAENIDVFFAKKNQLKNHEYEMHSGGFPCDHCGKKFLKKKYLNDHITRVV
jgi:uncharacterized protein (UPF0303 family)